MVKGSRCWKILKSADVALTDPGSRMTQNRTPHTAHLEFSRRRARPREASTNNFEFRFHHNMLRIRLPASVPSCLHLQGISLIRWRICAMVTRSHSRRIAYLNSSTVCHRPPRNRCRMISQIDSIGFRSHDCAGCRRILTYEAVLTRAARLSSFLPSSCKYTQCLYFRSSSLILAIWLLSCGFGGVVIKYSCQAAVHLSTRRNLILSPLRVGICVCVCVI